MMATSDNELIKLENKCVVGKNLNIVQSGAGFFLSVLCLRYTVPLNTFSCGHLQKRSGVSQPLCSDPPEDFLFLDRTRMDHSRGGLDKNGLCFSPHNDPLHHSGGRASLLLNNI